MQWCLCVKKGCQTTLRALCTQIHKGEIPIMNMIPAAKLVFDYVVAAFAPPAPLLKFLQRCEKPKVVLSSTLDQNQE